MDLILETMSLQGPSCLYEACHFSSELEWSNFDLMEDLGWIPSGVQKEMQGDLESA